MAKTGKTTAAAGALAAEAAGLATKRLIERIDRPRKDTPNVLSPAVPPADDGGETLGVAGEKLRRLAQGLICEVAEHRHLRHARVLLLVVEKEATAKKLGAGERVTIGKAARAKGVERLLTAAEVASKTDSDGVEKKTYARADFIVRLSGDYLQAVGWPEEEEAIEKAVALIDHELCHCGAKIAGEFIEPREIAERVRELGDDHVETCRDVGDDANGYLVRYYQRDDAGGFQWVVRHHDVEEFGGVVERHGPWRRDLLRLIDVIVKRGEMPLFKAAGKADHPDVHRDRAAEGKTGGEAA